MKQTEEDGEGLKARGEREAFLESAVEVDGQIIHHAQGMLSGCKMQVSF